MVRDVRGTNKRDIAPDVPDAPILYNIYQSHGPHIDGGI